MKFIETILKVIEKAGKKWLFWLILTICCLPLGFIFGYKYFSISGSFFVILMILLIFNFIKYIKNKKQAEYENLCKIYSIFKNLWDDERKLLIELFLNKTAERKRNKFCVEGSYGLRSKEFYELIDYDDINSGEGENAIIHYSYHNKRGCNYYYFTIDEDFRLENYEYFQKLYKQNKEIVNK